MGFKEQFPDTMTVGQLKEALADLPDELPVVTEGCDCYGPAASVNQGVWSDGSTPYVEILR